MHESVLLGSPEKYEYITSWNVYAIRSESSFIQFCVPLPSPERLIKHSSRGYVVPYFVGKHANVIQSTSTAPLPTIQITKYDIYIYIYIYFIACVC